MNNSTKLLENLKQRFKEKFSGNKYKSEIKTQTKNNNLYYMIHPTFRNINRLCILPFKAGENDPIRYSFVKYYMSLVEIKNFHALIDNRSSLIKLSKTNKKHMKNLLKCQEAMIIQQKTY